MSDIIKNYQPGNHKLIHHLSHLQNIVDGIPVGPIHLSVWPNAVCNFSCSYCCGKNVKDKSQQLTIDQYIKAISIFHKYGTLAVEFSGICGEPLLWPHMETSLFYNQMLGIKTSLITNGIFLKDLPSDILRKFAWVRVSIQNQNHFKLIDFDRVKANTKISISYIVANQKMLDGMADIWYDCKQNDIPMRVAVARPCSDEWEDAVRKECKLYDKAGWLFFSEKEKGVPSGCFMHGIRGALDWNGNFLPCPAIQLVEENEGKIPDKYVICNIDSLEEWILNNPIQDLGHRCSFCACGKSENEMVFNLLHKPEDFEFV